MVLSNDLISKFVKITRDDKKTKNETTVYGTIIESNGDKYVRFDGANENQLTPAIMEVDAEDGHRVSVLIKDHSAVVTGNLSRPAARKETVDVVTQNVEAQNAKISNIEADNIIINNTFTAHKARMDEIDADNVKINNTLTAQKATIDDLEANKLSVKDAELTYANIDFANIGVAAIEKLFTDSGIIGDLVMSDGHVTGKLVGVTIVGDLIEGNTVKAEKLVIRGTDGLYYKLNTTGATVSSEQTEYNSLSGTIITAKSITAEKVNVDDLVAVGATIGGFHITEDSIYSGAKESVDNTTRGIYQDTDGQFAIGDASNFLKFYKDTDGKYKLAISASTITFGDSGKSVDEAITEIQNLEIGGRNLIKGTKDFSGFYANTSTTEYIVGSDGFTYANFPSVTTAEYRAVSSTYAMLRPEDVMNRQVVLSFELRSDTAWKASGTNLIAGFALCNSNSTTRLKYRTEYLTGDVGTTWTRFELKATLTEDYFTNGTGNFDDCTRFYTQIYNYSVNPLQIRKIKLEYGNKATDWTPALEDTENAIDAITVGGRNLLRHTAKMPIVTNHTDDSGIGLFVTDTGTLTDTGDGIKLTYDSSGKGAIAVPLAYDGAVDSDETVTVSFKYRGNMTRTCYHYFLTRTTPNVTIHGFPALKASNTEWLEYKHTFSHAEANDRTCYSFMLAYNPGTDWAGTWIEIKKGSLKLERGNRATDWSPAPEDTDADIEEASKVAKNYMLYDSSNGLQIGDLRSGSWSGFRTQITNAAFRVLNSAGTVLASYGEKLIELGKNATDAVIKLCGGKGQIEYTPDYILQISGDSVRIKGVEEASLYANYTDSQGIFRNGAVHASPGQVLVTAGGGNQNSNVVVNPTNIQMATENFYISGTVNDSENGGKFISVLKGTSGIWSYSKWSDGTVDLWGVYSVSNLACTTALGGWYRTAVFTPNAFPFTVTNPRLVANYESDGYGAMLWATTTTTTTKPPSYYLIRPTSATITSGKIIFHVTGTWS